MVAAFVVAGLWLPKGRAEQPADDAVGTSSPETSPASAV